MDKKAFSSLLKGGLQRTKNKRQRDLTNPRPDLKRGREADERETSEGTGPSHSELNIRNKRRLEALSRRYPGKLELHVRPKGPRL